MTKYFVKETDEQLELGELISLNFDKGLEDGSITIEREFEFTEEIARFLTKMGFVEAREVDDEEEEEDLIEFEEPCAALNDLIEDFETMEQRMDKAEVRLAVLEKELLKSKKVK